MQQNSNLSINAAAWFFVGQSENVATKDEVRLTTPFRIGRSPTQDLCLPCISVSAQHAEIIKKDDELWLVDLKSTNGTFVNGNRIESHRLMPRDTVQFGAAVFQIEQDAAKETSGAPEGDNGETGASKFEGLFNGGVVPFFQEVIQINDNQRVTVGYEALGRSKLFGLRTPAQMFAAASKLEMEAELSRSLRMQVIKVADNNLAPDKILFINTHPAELECGGLDESLFEAREDYPERPIVLEVHESILNSPTKFSQLRSTMDTLNIRLAFHDFGAGQVKMAELSEIAPDYVKFDTKLIRGIDKATTTRQNFVASLVHMVRSMGIIPVAECIEQECEHDAVVELGFELGQGFYYSRPSPIGESNKSPAAELQQKIKSSDSIVGAIPKVESLINESISLESVTAEPPEHTKKSACRGPEWILEQPGNKYTIQVLSAIFEDRARDHIEEQDHPEQFAIFEKKGKTCLLYIVVHGSFESRADAKSAAVTVAKSSVSPWIRLMSSVQAEIHTPNK